MNYIDKIAARIGAVLGIVNPEPEDMRLLRIYALLVLTVGEDVTWQNVHDAWSAWRADTNPTHKSLIPFDELTYEVQALDSKYTEAIRHVAKNP